MYAVHMYVMKQYICTHEQFGLQRNLTEQPNNKLSEHLFKIIFELNSHINISATEILITTDTFSYVV